MIIRNIFITLTTLMFLYACSIDNDSSEHLSFSIKDKCVENLLAKRQSIAISDDLDEEDVIESNDSVLFTQKKDGSFSTEFEIGTYCGIDFDLTIEMNNDTIFIDTEVKSDVVTSCSCTTIIEATIPAKYTGAQILICNGKRKFPKNIVYQNGTIN